MWLASLKGDPPQLGENGTQVRFSHATNCRPKVVYVLVHCVPHEIVYEDDYDDGGGIPVSVRTQQLMGWASMVVR